MNKIDIQALAMVDQFQAAIEDIFSQRGFNVKACVEVLGEYPHGKAKINLEGHEEIDIDIIKEIMEEASSQIFNK